MSELKTTLTVDLAVVGAEKLNELTKERNLKVNVDADMSKPKKELDNLSNSIKKSLGGSIQNLAKEFDGAFGKSGDAFNNFKQYEALFNKISKENNSDKLIKNIPLSNLSKENLEYLKPWEYKAFQESFKHDIQEMSEAKQYGDTYGFNKAKETFYKRFSNMADELSGRQLSFDNDFVNKFSSSKKNVAEASIDKILSMSDYAIDEIIKDDVKNGVNVKAKDRLSKKISKKDLSGLTASQLAYLSSDKTDLAVELQKNLNGKGSIKNLKTAYNKFYSGINDELKSSIADTATVKESLEGFKDATSLKKNGKTIDAGSALKQARTIEEYFNTAVEALGRGSGKSIAELENEKLHFKDSDRENLTSNQISSILKKIINSANRFTTTGDMKDLQGVVDIGNSYASLIQKKAENEEILKSRELNPKELNLRETFNPYNGDMSEYAKRYKKAINYLTNNIANAGMLTGIDQGSLTKSNFDSALKKAWYSGQYDEVIRDKDGKEILDEITQQPKKERPEFEAVKKKYAEMAENIASDTQNDIAKEKSKYVDNHNGSNEGFIESEKYRNIMERAKSRSNFINSIFNDQFMQASEASTNSILSAKAQVDKYINENSKLKNNSAFYNRALEIQDLYQNALQNGVTKSGLTDYNKQFYTLQREAKTSGFAGKTFGENIKDDITSLSQWVGAMGLVFTTAGIVKDGFDTIKSLDSSMVELKKVTDESNESYDKFYLNANEKAKKLGVSTNAFIKQTASWSQLGFSLNEGAKLATESSIFKTISPEMSQDQATSTLISTSKAFGIGVDNIREGISSKINYLGNNYAANNNDLAEILKRSASPMQATGNSLDQVLALGVGAQEINVWSPYMVTYMLRA